MADSGLRMAQAGEAVPFEIPGATGEFRIQILNEDRDKGVVTSIVHLPPGGVIPAHYHEAGSEMHYVLEGDLIEAGEPLSVGAFLTHAKGVVHGPHESKGGAKVLTVQTWQSEGGNFDFRPAEGGAAAGSGGSGGSQSSGSQGPGNQGSGTGEAGSTTKNIGAETQEAAAADREEKGYS
ncbi:cupin domain-containing protein [Muricoccus pecuniae]|uniref:Quercetin dioxygenase-like cupin family protein n=1 Tax=Muricoccus pecuniae TaxID=693023 RepID=A0A840Y8X0_9PROT|nr:cupin domain-containing protein [Roseomonas pecuniae]MBB5692391.1 quercetin dioxygenase-like cupin family protein [Roseomonas pecuniae]